MVSALVRDAALVVVGVAGLWVSAGQFVAGASRLARRLGVSGLVIGLTVVSFGTSAPEFAVTVDAALTGEADISVGNVVGSCIFNVLGVLGVAATVHPLSAAGRRSQGPSGCSASPSSRRRCCGRGASSPGGRARCSWP